MHRVITIDYLRIIATLLVVFFHFFPENFPFGFIGVDIFFVISGYVIAGSIENNPNRDSLEFIRRRISRLIPALLSASIFITVLGIVYYSPKLYNLLTQSAIANLSGVSNYYFGTISGYFDFTSEINPFLHTWSLSVEWQFYFVIFIVLISQRKLKISKKIVYFVLIFLTLFSFISTLYLNELRPSLNFYSLSSRYYEFMVGFLLYSSKKTFINNASNFIIPFLFLTLIFWGEFSGSGWPNLTTLGLSILTILIIKKDHMSINSIGRSKIIWLSDRTYSIYLFHFPLAALTTYYNIESVIVKIILIIVSFCIASLNFRFIENPYRYNFISQMKISYFVLPVFGWFILTYYYTQTENIDDIYSSYVTKEFNKLSEKLPQKEDSEKILLIGDSYAQDFSNIILEGKIYDQSKIYTHSISMNCGNLYNVSNRKLPYDCDYTKYNQFISSLNENDLLILSSNWKNEYIDLLDKSLTNIRKIFSGQIIIVGNKHIGKINPFLMEGLTKKSLVRTTPPKYVTESNIKLKNLQIIQNDSKIRFLDLQELLIDRSGKGIPFETGDSGSCC